MAKSAILRIDESIAKRQAKKSIFTEIFTNPYYALKFYKLTFPDDKQITENDITELEGCNINLNSLYSYVTFMARDLFVFIAGMHPPFNYNITLMSYFYITQKILSFMTKPIDDGATSTPNINIRKRDKNHVIINYPVASMALIYTGDDMEGKDVISLSETHFNGKKTAVEITLQMLHARHDQTDIVSQYILFCRILEAYRLKYKNDQLLAIKQTVEVCKEKNILRGYFNQHEREAESIMNSLFVQADAVLNYAEAARTEGMEQGREEERNEAIKKWILRLNSFNISRADILTALKEDFALSQKEANIHIARCLKII